MENMTRKVERMARKNAKRRLWHRFVAIPAALVVFVTTYALILPAIAMEGETYCGMEAHTHTDECYKRVLACGYESGELVGGTISLTELDCPVEVHQHEAGCYDAEGNVICGYADFVVHTHNSDCYDASGALVCPLKEVKEHEHTDACYSVETINVCGLAESEGHTHTDACYTVTAHSDLVCGLAESEGHTHTDSCYTSYENTYLACGQDEYEGHTHSDSCYTTTVAEDGTEVTELTCGQEEYAGHTHSDACYATETITELTCGQEEYAGHTHSEACYNNYETSELTCGLEESEGHTHTDECFVTEKTLICGKPEAVLHTHEASCFDQYGNLICPEIEVLEHTHDEDCFVTYEQNAGTAHEHTDVCYVLNLDCDKPEHVHDQSCYQAPEEAAQAPAEETEAEEADQAPAEEAAEPALICGIEEHAHTELCYDENSQLICGFEEHAHSESCYAQPETAEVPEAEEITETAPEMVLICDQLMHEHTDTCYAEAVCGLVEHTHSETCYDETGALICEVPEHTHTADCCGLVQIEEDETPEAFVPELICGKEEHIHTAECMDANLEYICGKEAHEHVSECWSKPYESKTFFDGTVTVTATYTPAANIPEEAYLKAYKITAESDPERYAARVAQANALLNGSNQYAEQMEVYNIGFYIDGVEIEPEAPVQVEVKFLDSNGFTVDDSLSVVHFAESGTELIEASADSQENAASFETGSFSDFVLRRDGGADEGADAPQVFFFEGPTFEGQMDGETPANETETAPVVEESPFHIEVNIIAGEPDGMPQGDAFMDGPEIFEDYGIMTTANAPEDEYDPNDLGDFLKGAVLTDKDGNPIENGGTLYVGDTYHVKFSFAEGGVGGRQMGNGELVYHIPKNFDVEPFSEHKTQEFTYKDRQGNEHTGRFEYWVDRNGDLRVKTTDPENYQAQTQKLQIEVELDAELTNKGSEGGVNIPLGDETNLRFDVIDDLRPEMKKTAGSFNPATRSVQYTVEVDSSRGELKNWSISDAFDLKAEGAAGSLKYESTMTCEYTITDANGEVKRGTLTATVSPDGKSFTIDPMPELAKGQKLTLNYAAVLDENSGKVDDDGTIHWSVERNEVTLEPDKGGYRLEDHADVTVDSDVLTKDGSQVNGQNEITWTVQIGDGHNMDFAGATVTDVAGEGLTFALKNGDKLQLEIYDAQTKEKKGTIEVPVKIDGQKMTYVIPSKAELEKVCGGSLPEYYYLKTKYNTTTPGTGTFKNTVSTTVKGTTWTDSDEVTVVGPMGNVEKKITNLETAYEEGYLEFTATVYDIPAMDGGTAFRFGDEFRFTDYRGAEHAYVLNTAPYMELEDVTLYDAGTRDNGTQLLPRTDPDTEEVLKDNSYIIRDYTNDSGTEVCNFYLYFNVGKFSWPSQEENGASGSRLYLEKPSDLEVKYRVSLDAPVYSDKRGNADGGDNRIGSLRELLDKGYTVTNESTFIVGNNDKSDSVDYSNPKLDNGVIKSGVLKQTEDGRSYVEYQVIVNNPVKNGKGVIAHPEKLTLTDSFNEYLTFDEDYGLHIEVWAPNFDKGYAQYRSSNRNRGVTLTPNGDGTTTLTAVGGDFNERFAHTPDEDNLWPERDGVTNSGSWAKSKATFTDGVLYYGGLDGKREDGAEPFLIVFVYRCWVDEAEVQEYVGSYVPLKNDATVTDGSFTASDERTINYPTGQMTKEAVLKSDSNVASFTIDFNAACKDLVPAEKDDSKDRITLQDQMSVNLDPLTGSVKVWTNKLGETPMPYTDFFVTWDEETHTMTISNLPDREHVKITYDAVINVDVGGPVDVKNTAWLEGNQDYKYEYDGNFDVRNVDANIGADVKYFTIKKQDAEDGTGLAGAEFALYIVPTNGSGDPRRGETLEGTAPSSYGDTHEFGEETGYFIGYYTTRANGTVLVNNQFLDNTGNYKYVLVEVKAPTGYQLPTDPLTWFYYDNEPEGMEVEVVPYDDTLAIDNTNYGYELPETGGVGTMVYTLGGMAMLALAGAVYSGKQRRRARHHG